MLTRVEKRGCYEILADLSLDELISLGNTVTKKQVKLTTAKG